MRYRSTKVPAALAALVASVACGLPIGAQVSEVSRRPIADIAHLTFGSLCDDRFIIRNDGPNSVDVEYAVPKGNGRTPLTLGGREQVELEVRSGDDLELWMDGKLVAKAEKEGQKCKDIQGNAMVAIAPLNVPTQNDRSSNNARNARLGFGVGFGSPFYDPWYGPFGAYGWGYQPFYSGFYGRPIFIGGRSRRR
jgi:hypothetical protein